MEDQHVLADIMAPNLEVVIVGTAVGDASQARGHYYSSPSNKFWTWLHRTGMTPTKLRPEDDRLLPAFGIGLTDLNKTVHQSHNRGLDYDHQGFIDCITPFAPKIVAFNGKDGVEGSKGFGAYIGEEYRGFGPQDWSIGESLVFVLPATSNNWPERQLRDTSGQARSVIDYWYEMVGLLPARGEQN